MDGHERIIGKLAGRELYDLSTAANAELVTKLVTHNLAASTLITSPLAFFLSIRMGIVDALRQLLLPLGKYGFILIGYQTQGEMK